MSEPSAHWDSVYSRKEPTEVSWFEPTPRASLELIESMELDRGAPVVDVGAGASHLAGELLSRGFQDVTAIDVSAAAAGRARADLGSDAAKVKWVTADIRAHRFGREFALWHDRAVLHFMVDPADRAAYIETARMSIASDGHAVIATFGPDGPTTCSGLPVRRYSASELAEAMGSDFTLVSSREVRHETPTGNPQQFVYAHLRRTGGRRAQSKSLTSPMVAK